MSVKRPSDQPGVVGGWAPLNSGLLIPSAYLPSTTPAILLDYDLGSDISGQAITGGTYFDVIANQNFTKVYTNSLIAVSVRGNGFMNDASTGNVYKCRINVDSGGTPVLKHLAGAFASSLSTNPRGNLLAGGVVYIPNLAAGVHTIKVQVTSTGNDHFYCRATGAPDEFLSVQVVEIGS